MAELWWLEIYILPSTEDTASSTKFIPDQEHITYHDLSLQPILSRELLPLVSLWENRYSRVRQNSKSVWQSEWE